MMRLRRTKAAETTTLSTLFITKDTFITNDNDKHGENHGESTFLRVGRGSGNIISQTFLGIYDSDKLPSDQIITSMKLCIYQYFAGSNAGPEDAFRINLITGSWNDDITATSKPTVGARIGNVYFTSTNGKECIEFTNAQIERLKESHGVIISGGSSSEKKERYFTSSEWLSKSRDVVTTANSSTYHPHWVITSSKIEPTTITQNDDIIMNQRSYTVLIVSCIACMMLIMSAGFYYWRRRRSRQNRKFLDDDTRFDSYDEIFSVHDPRLQDMFRINNNTSDTSTLSSKVRTTRHVTNSSQPSNNNNNNNNKQREVAKSKSSRGSSRQSKSASGSGVYSGSRRKQNGTKHREDNASTVSSKLYPTSNSLYGESVNTNVLVTQAEPCLLNKVCLKVVNRKECDIDYVAPGVASVVDNQCAVNNRRSR